MSSSPKSVAFSRTSSFNCFQQRKNDVYKTVAFPYEESTSAINEACVKYGFVVSNNSANGKHRKFQSSDCNLVEFKKYKIVRIQRNLEKVSEAILVKSMNPIQKYTLNKEKCDLNNFVKTNLTNIKGNGDKNGQRDRPWKNYSLKEENLRIKTSNLPTRNIISKENQLQDKEQIQSTNKFEKVHKHLKSLAQSYGINPVSFENLRVYIGRGNNSQLIKQIIKQRWWLTFSDSKHTSSFLWTQIKDKDFYQRQINNQVPFLHNHFIWNDYLGNKKELYYLMRKHYTKKNKNVFDFLPETYHVKKINDEQWKKFIARFKQDKPENLTKNQFTCSNGLIITKGWRKKITNNLWIVKPGENSNRGSGITLCKTIEEIQEILKDKTTKESSTSSTPEYVSENKEKKNTIIIQKYIMKPFLYYRRKFDLRCFMLLVKLGNCMKGYWCKEGYIRTSSEEFDVTNYKDSFVHLTNDAIQCHSEVYGKYEDGNKLSFGGFQKYLDANFPKKYNFFEDLIPKLKQISLDIMEASEHLADNMPHPAPVFELFGLDFMIDDKFRPWLIEVNTNPSIQNNCTAIKSLIPKILNDALKLSLDVIFPPPTKKTKNQHHLELPHIFELIFDKKIQSSSKNSQKMRVSSSIEKNGQKIQEINIKNLTQNKRENQKCFKSSPLFHVKLNHEGSKKQIGDKFLIKHINSKKSQKIIKDETSTSKQNIFSHI